MIKLRQAIEESTAAMETVETPTQAIPVTVEQWRAMKATLEKVYASKDAE